MIATDSSTLVDSARQVLQMPSDFGYFGNDPALFVSSGLTFGRHRDSEHYDNARFEVVWASLCGQFPDLVSEAAREEQATVDPVVLSEMPRPERNSENPGGVYVFGSSHWAVGWSEQIVVPVLLDPSAPLSEGNLHPAFLFVVDAAEDYPDAANDLEWEMREAANLSQAVQWRDWKIEQHAETPYQAFTAEEYAFARDENDEDLVESLDFEEINWVLCWEAAHAEDASHTGVPGQETLL